MKPEMNPSEAGEWASADRTSTYSCELVAVVSFRTASGETITKGLTRVAKDSPLASQYRHKFALLDSTEARTAIRSRELSSTDSDTRTESEPWAL